MVMIRNFYIFFKKVGRFLQILNSTLLLPPANVLRDLCLEIIEIPGNNQVPMLDPSRILVVVTTNLSLICLRTDRAILP